MMRIVQGRQCLWFFSFFVQYPVLTLVAEGNFSPQYLQKKFPCVALERVCLWFSE
jgi:hypothetical protein